MGFVILLNMSDLYALTQILSRKVFFELSTLRFYAIESYIIRHLFLFARI
jgi:hypothetical protein